MPLLNKPNLPCSKVKSVLISEEATQAIEALEELKIKVVKVSAAKNLPWQIASHADVNFLHIKEKILLLNNSQKDSCKHLHELGYLCESPQEGFGNCYPADSLLNAAIVGDHIICNPKTVSAKVLEAINRVGYRIISVNQGYSKCSTLIIGEKAIITTDTGVNTAAQFFGIDTLLISTNSIRLKGYDYGFIGGCGGMIDKNVLAFTGNYMLHPDGDKIFDFCSYHNVNIITLTDGPLVDIGGILPIEEARNL